MSLYDYTCANCGAEFVDVEQRITELPLVTCEKCGQPTLKRLITKTSFVLKGGGWANELYATSKQSNGSKND